MRRRYRQRRYGIVICSRLQRVELVPCLTVCLLVRSIDRLGQEERGIKKADQGKEEQRKEGVGCWPPHCQAQGQEGRQVKQQPQQAHNTHAFLWYGVWCGSGEGLFGWICVCLLAGRRSRAQLGVFVGRCVEWANERIKLGSSFVVS